MASLRPQSGPCLRQASKIRLRLRSSIFPSETTMNTAELIEKIEALPRDEREEAEKFVDSLRARRLVSEARSLMERVRVRRESVLRRRGLLDSTAILRDVREHGA